MLTHRRARRESKSLFAQLPPDAMQAILNRTNQGSLAALAQASKTMRAAVGPSLSDRRLQGDISYDPWYPPLSDAVRVVGDGLPNAQQKLGGQLGRIRRLLETGARPGEASGYLRVTPLRSAALAEPGATPERISSARDLLLQHARNAQPRNLGAPLSNLIGETRTAFDKANRCRGAAPK